MRLVIARSRRDGRGFHEPSLAPVDLVGGRERGKANLTRRGVDQVDRVLAGGLEPLELFGRGHLCAVKVESLEIGGLSAPMRLDSHDPQKCDPVREREREDVAGAEPAARPRRRTETLTSRLDAGELHPGLVEYLAPLWHQLRAVQLPCGEVGPRVERRQGSVTDGGVEATDLRLRYGEREKERGALLGIVQVTPELLDGQSSRFGVFDTVLDPLPIGVADIAGGIA